LSDDAPPARLSSPPNRNSHLAGLVREVLEDAETGKSYNRNRRGCEREVIPFEEPRVLVPGPVWLEGDLPDFPILGLAAAVRSVILRPAPLSGAMSGWLSRTLSSVAQLRVWSSQSALSRTRSAGTERQKHLPLSEVACVQKSRESASKDNDGGSLS
jgi:hypothetical protein